jgi:hypothetical protein
MQGRLMKWLRLVKQPKYLIGVLIFGAYYGWIFFGHDFGGRARGASPFSGLGAELIVPVRLVAALGIAALLSLGFLLFSRQPLGFDEAEIQHLFTAPLSRRALIRYALLKYQPGLLVGSFISVMLFSRGDMLQRVVRWPSIWSLFTASLVLATAQGLWKARLDELPARQALRTRVVTWSLLATYWIAVILFVAHGWTQASGIAGSSGTMASWLAEFGQMLERNHALRALALPFELPLWTVLATSGAERAVGWAVTAGVIVAVAEWCARSPVSFEDASIENARRLSEIRSRGLGATRRSRSPKARARHPFQLAAAGTPEIGIVWKNLLVVGRIPLRRALSWAGLALMVILAVTVALGAPEPLVAVEMILGCMFGAMIPIAAGSAWRNDLRVDLLHVDQLRTWPIPAHRLIAAEVAAPAIATMLVATFALAVALVGAVSGSIAHLIGTARGGEALRAIAVSLDSSAGALAIIAFIAAMPLVAAFACLSCTLQNVGVLLFPGWTRLGTNRAPGAAAFGQQILLGVGRMVAMVVGLVPGVVVVAALALGQQTLDVPFRAWELPIATSILAASLLAETFVLVVAAGRLWDGMDPSRELLEGNAA